MSLLICVLTSIFAHATDCAVTLEAERFHAQALADKTNPRFGQKRRIVYLMSSNAKKLREYRVALQRYGIEVLQAPVIEDPRFLSGLLATSVADARVLSVLRETSDLFVPNTVRISSRTRHAERVENRTSLVVYTLENGELKSKTFADLTTGYIDLARREDAADIFGWDDVFVLDRLGRSYLELNRNGYKISSRDLALSRYIVEDIYYPQKVDLKYNPQHPGRVVDFSKTISQLVNNVAILNGSYVKAYHLDDLFRAVANQGVFFRAPLNRRAKIYWLPGLNAGIPLTPKKDLIHEITYLVHDLGHALLPDLIFTGTHSKQNRSLYIAYRMMSEAITLVLADMLYVDTLNKSGLDYDFSKRKIYPLFQATRIDFSDPAKFLPNLKRLIKANVSYCLRGDDQAYRELIGHDQAGLQALGEFKRKYMPFFVEDYRWTERNYDNMVSRSVEIQKWYKMVSPLSSQWGIELETIDTFAAKISQRSGDLVDQVFEQVWQTILEPIFTQRQYLLAPDHQRQRAFARYVLGQFGIFARFGFAPGSLDAQSEIIRRMDDNADAISLPALNGVRAVYERYVQNLRKLNLLSNDDVSTYREVYPLFDPFFIYYDGAAEFYEDLGSIAKRLVGP